MYLWWAKPRLVTSRSHPGLVVLPKALAMARLSAVASLLTILAPSSSRLCPPAPYCWIPFPGWHPTAHRRLAPYCSSSLAGIRSARWLRSPSPLRLSDLFSLTPTRRIVLPPWLLSNALNQYNDLHRRVSGCSGPAVSLFSLVSGHLPNHLRPAFRVLEQAVFFVLGSLLKGLGLSTCTFLCIISLRVWGILS